MNRKELLDSINLNQELIAKGRKNRPGNKIPIKWLTIHNTDNTDVGADANAHSSFVRNTGHYVHNGKTIWVSWHYTVDDTRAIRQLPDDERSYHAGSDANSSSISMEICMHAGNNQPVANDRAARLAALILHDQGLPLSAMVTHKSWTGKNCPSLLVSERKWTVFQNAVKQYLVLLSPAAAKPAKATAVVPFHFAGCQCGLKSGHVDA